MASSGWAWWREVMLPGILPYFVTGALTAWAAPGTRPSWRRSPRWGHTTCAPAGLGAYIADATAAGDYPRIVLGVAVMSVFVVVLNRRCGARSTSWPSASFRFD